MVKSHNTINKILVNVGMIVLLVMVHNKAININYDDLGMIMIF